MKRFGLSIPYILNWRMTFYLSSERAEVLKVCLTTSQMTYSELGFVFLINLTIIP